MGSYLRRFVGILSALAATYAAVIVPGATWTDTSGNVIQAHGAGILKVLIFFTDSQTPVTHATVKYTGRVTILLVR